MAEEIGALYMRLGLSLSELETGFVAAERTVNENVRRLNRESDLIRLRAQVEIEGLDAAEDAERILQIRQESLNRQMEIQRDRVRVLTAEWQNLAQQHGADAVAAQRAEIRLERERLALARLESELRNLGDTQEESNSLFEELADLLPEMPTKLQAIGMAAGAVASGFGAAGAAVNALLEDFREIQNQSYELNMSFGDTDDFLQQMKLAGGDIGDFEGYIRGITDAYVKGEYDDPEFIALRRYGAEITDAAGRLKNFKDLTDEVFQAYEKAKAEGNGIEFLQLTGGEAGVRDAIQFFERLKEAREDAAKIAQADLDEKQLHELDRALGLVEEQSRELKNALGDIFVPAAQAAAEKFFNALHDGTEWLVENKDAIQRWGFIAEEVFSTVADKISKDYAAVGEFVEKAVTPKTTGDNRVDNVLDDMSWRYGSAQIPYGVDNMRSGITEATESYGVFNDAVDRAEKKQAALNAELEQTADDLDEIDEKLQDADGNPLSQYGWQRVQQFRDELAELRTELDNWGNDYDTALAQLDLWRDQELTQKNYVSAEERAAVEELYSAKLEQIEAERADRISEIRRGVEAETQTALEQRLAKIAEEKEAWISAGMEEAEASELAQRRIAQAYEDAAAKAQAYWQNAADIEFELTHTALEKQLRDIEQWKTAQLEKAETAEETAGIIANAAAKEAQAFENAIDRIKGKLQTLDDKIFEIDHSQYENDLRRIQQEYLRTAEDLQKEGVFDEATKSRLDYLYSRQKANLDKRAEESRKSGSDYTKTPDGGYQRGSNGIVVIGGDQITDDGLNQSRQQEIGLLIDESRIRSQLLPKLDAETQAAVERIQAAKNLTDTEKILAKTAQEAASGFELIEGDKFTAPPQSTPGIALIESDTVTTNLQEFETALQDVAAELEQVEPFKEPADNLLALSEFKEPADNLLALSEFKEPADNLLALSESTQEVADAQKTLTEAVNAFPAEYLKNLADGAKSVSDMQLGLTNSTMELIDAQSKLRDALNNLPAAPPAQEQTDLPSDGFQQISRSAQELVKTQDLLVSQSRELEELPVPSRQDKADDWQVGFDMDTAGLVAGLASLGLMGATAPISAPVIGGITVASLLAGLAKGTYDETTAAREQDAPLKEIPAELDSLGLTNLLTAIDEKVQGILERLTTEATPPESTADFSELPILLGTIAEKVQSVLDEPQPYLNDRLQESLGVLPNIESSVGNILQQMQAEPPESVSTPENPSSDLSTPLTGIDTTLRNILQEMQNFKPATVEDSPAPQTDYAGQLSRLDNLDTPLSNVLAELQRSNEESSGVAELPTIDFAQLLTPLTAIDEKVQGVLQQMQAQNTDDPLQDLRDALAGIESSLQESLRQLEALPKTETVISFEAVVTPLNNIAGLAEKILAAGTAENPTVTPLNNIAGLTEKILAAIGEREPPQINVSPNLDIDLGGAYVFDDKLKKTLVDDITNTVVTAIKDAVQQATSQTNYSYSA